MTNRVGRAEWNDTVLSENGPIESSMRLVGLAIAKHAHKDGSGSWPSLRLLEDETGLSRPTVEKAIKKLLGGYWVSRRPRRKGNYGRTLYEYLLTIPFGEQQQGSVPQWLTDGQDNGQLNGQPNGQVIGKATCPEPITHNPNLITQEETLTRPEDPAKEVLRGKTITDLDLGADAIAICQKARPGADPLEVIRKFREKLGSGPALGWQKSLATFAIKERLTDDDMRAAERGRSNGTGPRRPGETAEEYRRRSQDPPISADVSAAIRRIHRSDPSCSGD